jgi:hypothetical protein
MFKLIADYLAQLPGTIKDEQLPEGTIGHRHVITTQIYDKRRRQAHEGASHSVLI